jgi:hypothetical protein
MRWSSRSWTLTSVRLRPRCGLAFGLFVLVTGRMIGFHRVIIVWFRWECDLLAALRVVHAFFRAGIVVTERLTTPGTAEMALGDIPEGVLSGCALVVSEFPGRAHVAHARSPPVRPLALHSVQRQRSLSRVIAVQSHAGHSVGAAVVFVVDASCLWL